jgi:hypothetical protein
MRTIMCFFQVHGYYRLFYASYALLGQIRLNFRTFLSNIVILPHDLLSFIKSEPAKEARNLGTFPLNIVDLRRTLPISQATKA